MRNRKIKIFGFGTVILLFVAVMPSNIYAKEISTQTVEEAILLENQEFDFSYSGIILVNGIDEINLVLTNTIEYINKTMFEIFSESKDVAVKTISGNASSGKNTTMELCGEISVGSGSTYIKITVCVEGPIDEVADMLKEAMKAAKQAYDDAKEIAEETTKKIKEKVTPDYPWYLWFIIPDILIEYY